MTRWRDRPRRTLRRRDLTKEYAIVPILLFFAWLTAGQYLAAAVFGGRDPGGSDWRSGSALYGLAALAVALGMTRFVWLYLRRPLVPEDDWERERPVAGHVARRAEAEQEARDHRIGPGY